MTASTTSCTSGASGRVVRATRARTSRDWPGSTPTRTRGRSYPSRAPTPTIVYCGNDGGLFRSTDNGVTWVPRNAGGVQTALFYNLAAKPDVGGSVLLGALQDNGIQTTAGAASPGWNSPQGGDGWDIAFDGVTAGRAYGTSGFWSPAPCTRVWRSDNDGASWPTEVTPWGTTSDAGCYLAPISCDPSAAGRRLRERQPESLAEPGRRQHVAQPRRVPRHPWPSRRRTATASWSRRGPGVRQHQRACGDGRRTGRRHVHEHHAQLAEPQRAARRVRSGRCQRALRRARRLQRRGRPAGSRVQNDGRRDSVAGHLPRRQRPVRRARARRRRHPDDDLRRQ